MDESGTADRVDRAALSRQWRREGRYEEIAEFRQQVKEATKKAWRSAGRHWDRDELNEVAWQEAARAFPPLDTEGTATDSQSESAHCGRVQGLVTSWDNSETHSHAESRAAESTEGASSAGRDRSIPTPPWDGGIAHQ